MGTAEGQPGILKALQLMLVKRDRKIHLGGLRPTKSSMSLLWLLFKFSAEW